MTGQVYGIFDDKGNWKCDVTAEQVQKALSDTSKSQEIKTADQQQLEIFLQETSKPVNVQEMFWAIDHTLALIKISNFTEMLIWELRIENIVNAFMLENMGKISLLDMEQLMFRAKMQLRRSITYDGQPTERAWWATVQSHQRFEGTGVFAAQPGMNPLDAVKRFFTGNKGQTL